MNRENIPVKQLGSKAVLKGFAFNNRIPTGKIEFLYWIFSIIFCMMGGIIVIAGIKMLLKLS